MLRAVLVSSLALSGCGLINAFSHPPAKTQSCAIEDVCTCVGDCDCADGACDCFSDGGDCSVTAETSGATCDGTSDCSCDEESCQCFDLGTCNASSGDGVADCTGEECECDANECVCHDGEGGTTCDCELNGDAASCPENPVE